MTEPTRPPRPFDDPDTDEFAVEYDETWIVDAPLEKADERGSSDGDSDLNQSHI